MKQLCHVVAIAIAFLIVPLAAARSAGTGCASFATTCNTGDRYQFKAVILDFVDPQSTEIGDSLSRLLWREVIYALSDLNSTAVIRAPAVNPGSEARIEHALGKAPTDLLSDRLHQAAVDIAEVLNAQMAVWGAVVGGTNNVTIYSFLSVRPAAWKKTIGLALAEKAALLAAPLSHTDYNFDPLVVGRDEFFKGSVKATCKLMEGCPEGIPTFKEPSDASEKSFSLSEGELVAVTSMTGKWLRIKRREDGSESYLNIYHADIGPRAVFVKSNNSSLKANPNSSRAIGSVQSGKYNVDELVRVGREEAQRIWYKVSTNDATGWLRDDAVEPLYRFPSAHFIAGLYRYAAGQYGRAEREFSHFLEDLSPGSDVILRSTALQLIAASQFQVNGPKNAGSALELLTSAAKVTPFDPAIFNMRALIDYIRAKGGAPLDPILRDLSISIYLDSTNADTQKLVDNVVKVLGTNKIKDQPTADYIEQLRALRTTGP